MKHYWRCVKCWEMCFFSSPAIIRLARLKQVIAICQRPNHDGSVSVCGGVCEAVKL